MTRKSRSITTRGSRTVSTMASAKLCPCATAAKGLRSDTPDDSSLSAPWILSNFTVRPNVAGRIVSGRILTWLSHTVQGFGDVHERQQSIPFLRRSSPPTTLILRTGLGPMAHDLLWFLVVNFCERVVCLTVRMQ